MNLQLLDFDASEDTEGGVCWDALACPQPSHNPALLQEVAGVLKCAHRGSTRAPGSLDDGADWDFDLQATWVCAGVARVPASVRFDPDTGQLSVSPCPEAKPTDPLTTWRLELSLSLSGTPAFALAMRDQLRLP